MTKKKLNTCNKKINPSQKSTIREQDTLLDFFTHNVMPIPSTYDKTNKIRKIEIGEEHSFQDSLEKNAINILKFYNKNCPHCINLGNFLYETVSKDPKYAKHNIQFLNIESSDNEEIFDQFDIEGVPTTCFLTIDKKKKINSKKEVMGDNKEGLVKTLNQILNIAE